MRILAALVLILAAVLIGMAARGEFGPVASPTVRPTTRPTAASTTAAPTATRSRAVTVTLTEQQLTEAAKGYMPLTVSGITVTDPTKQNVADTFAQVLAKNIPAGMRVTSLTVNAGALVVEAVPA